jgi:hypothetical protein
MRLLPVPQAVSTAEKDYRKFDFHRERNDIIDEVHRLTNAGVSAVAIAGIVGMSDRQVQRLRTVEPVPKRWYRYDRSEIRSERLERTADAALDLACRLRDEDPQLVFRSIELLDRQALQELAMVLLAAVPLDRSKDEIFGWVEEVTS